MFSGLWKLDGHSWKRSSPSAKPLILNVHKSYTFHAPNGNTISLKEGDILVLLSKDDNEWWQVRKIGDTESTTPFSVPNTYINELISGRNTGCRKGTKPLHRSQGNLLVSHLNPSVMEHENFHNVHNEASPHDEPNMQRVATHSASKHKKSASFSLSSSWHGQFPKSEKQKIHKSISERLSLATAMQETPVYSNLEEMKKAKGTPPSPTCSPVQILENWECHLDPVTGRHFFVNTETREKTWKPPRRSKDRISVQICDSLEEQTQFSPSSSSSSSSLYGPSSDDQVHDPDPPVQRLSYTKSMILSNSRGPRVNHRRNLSHHQFESYGNPNPITDVPHIPVVTVLDVPYEVEKADQLNKTKIAEGGRKLKKNWTSALVVLTGNSLVFYKDPKVQAPSGWKPSNSKPESSVDLRGANIDWAQEMSSKKNVIHLRMVTGNEFLLQSDKESVIQEWYDALQRIIERLDRENPLDDIILRRTCSMEGLDGSAGEEESFLKSKDSWKFSLSWVSSGVGGPDRKNVKNRLKNLLVRRPPLQTLQEKGLIKDQVFGCRLDALCHREGGRVPKFVRLCIEAVNERGLDADGIYRVNGNLATIQKLRFVVDREEKLDLNSSEWEDIHVITGALKMFFRELPEPLIPFSMFDEFVAAVKITDATERIEIIKNLVKNLPEANHDTLKYITCHLKGVMERSESNRMTTQNIGIVFGPTLMRPEKELFSNIAANMVYQNQVVEHFLTYYQEIFSSGPEE
ncbi:rho GTPase-activating protein 9 isoform X2 [Spea bombifrons]|uniref:rho GTPase-activating protein 9 isoform X2 n=1 Tax=Spea bombifrons TaxID=233779 RepID=UPI00234B6721|nr:rho GTPase-activating protein 9 isoform X2 [Spea bombifrons]